MMHTKRSLRLLSIEDGCIRGTVQLLILRKILLRIKEEQGYPYIPRPCEIFDLAGGTGTGGIIVIMLFRLRMTIDAAIDGYRKLSEHIFSEKKWFFQAGKFKTTRLEEAMLSIIQECEVGDPRQVQFLNTEGPKCIVTAMYKWNTGPTFFRSWTSNSSIAGCTIVDAVRATTAVSTLFKAARIGTNYPMEYLDCKLQCSNPSKYMVGMARELYGDQPISCLLSLGTGDKYAVIMKPCSPWWDPFRRWSLLQALQNINISCEQTSRELESEFSRHFSPILYIRLKDSSDGLWPQTQEEWKSSSNHRIRSMCLAVAGAERYDF